MRSWRELTKWLIAAVCVIVVVVAGCSDHADSGALANDDDSDVGVDTGNDLGDVGGDVGDLDGDVGEECEEGLYLCGDACVNRQSDPDHCGECGLRCEDGESCVAATCESEVEQDCTDLGCPDDYYCEESDGQCYPGCESNIDCPSGAHGQPRCIDHSCTVECDVGARLCDEACVLCPDGAGIADTSCSGGECVPALCDDGFELCGGECAQCPGDGSGTESFGCSGQQCVISNCEEGYRYCNGDCAACPDDDPNGALQCDGTQCILACSNGFHECDGQCVPSDIPDSCGGRCEPCPSDNAGEAICTDSLECSLQCDAGYALCDESCAACPDDDPNGALQCDGSACVLACDSGFHECSGACVPSDVPDSCGGSCLPCPSDDAGEAICTDSLECSLQCDAGYELCDESCAQCPDGSAVLSTICDGAHCVADSCDSGYWQCEGDCCGYPDSERIHNHTAVLAKVDIVVDEQKRPHIAYGAENAMVVQSWDGRTWIEHHVDSGSVMTDASIDIDDDGTLHVAYRHSNNSSLKYGRKTATGWVTTTVDQSADVGEYASIAVDSDGHPHIAYRDSSNYDLKFAFYDGDNWTIEIAHESANNVGRLASVALDDNDNPHITYYDVTDNVLRHAWRAGGSWSNQVITSANRVDSDMTADDDGELHLAYRGSSDTQNYAHFDGDQWSTSLVSSKAIVRTSIAVGSDGLPEIFFNYTSTNAHAPAADHLRYDGSEWIEDTDLLNLGGTFQAVFRHLAIAIDDDGVLHAAYMRGYSDYPATRGTYYYSK